MLKEGELNGGGNPGALREGGLYSGKLFAGPRVPSYATAH